MLDVINWLFKMLSHLVESALSWKVFEEFSYLHIVLGLALLLILLSFLTFGYIHSGGAADYVGAGLRSKRNEENRRDREEYRQSYDNYKRNRENLEKYRVRYSEEKRGIKK